VGAMGNILKVIENQKFIANLIMEEGFDSPIFFKGFSKKEEHNLNLHLTSNSQNPNSERPKVRRRVSLQNKLRVLLGIEICVSADNEIMPFFRQKLELSNASVKTTINELKDSSTTFKEKMLTYFGENWKFNKIDCLEYSDERLIKSSDSRKRIRDETRTIEHKNDPLKTSLAKTISLKS
jgi:hypothetical protein